MKFKNRPLVFVVEDNIAYRMIIRTFLQQQGYMVMQFEHGKSAADMLKYIQPSLIISDIEMPCMDGFEFHSHVKNHFSEYDIPFIYISSTSSESTKEKATKLGATKMLDKPVSPHDLKEAISTILLKQEISIYQFKN